MNTNISSSLERLVQNYYLHELHILGDSTHINNRYADKHKSELPSEDEDAITFLKKLLTRKLHILIHIKISFKNFLNLMINVENMKKMKSAINGLIIMNGINISINLKKIYFHLYGKSILILLAYDHAIDRMTIMLKKAVVMIN